MGKQIEFVSLLDMCFKDDTNCVICVSGSPGAGKTFTVVQTCFFINDYVLKLAPTNALASQIKGRTIHSGLQLAWGVGSCLQSVTDQIQELEYDPKYIEKSLKLSEQITLKSDYFPKVVIIDEVGMVPFWLIYRIIRYFFENSTSVIVVVMGDRYQLRPVSCKYNIFNVVLPDIHIRHLDLSSFNKRFDDSYRGIMDSIMSLIREGETEGNFEHVYDYIRSTFPVIDYMTETLLKKTKKILAHRNSTVALYNRQYLSLKDSAKINLPQVKDNVVYKNVKITVKPFCEIVTIEPTRELPKGTRLTFCSYDPDADILNCYHDHKIPVSIKRNKNSGMFPIELAFATTVHKYQGSTIDAKVIIDFDYNEDVYFMYTALSRVRSLDQIIGILHIK